MRIIYMGTPEFAAEPLEALFKSGFEVVLAVTRPDRARGRGKQIQSPPVKDVALRYGMPLLQPETVKGNAEFLRSLAEAEADLIVTAAYGRILPVEALSAPRLGCVNIHASLLPKYRGAAPIQRAVIDGEEETGVSLMWMTEEMDAGDVIAVKKTAIGRKTASELFTELAGLGAGLLVEALPDIEAGRAERRPQDHSEATYAPMIRKEEGHVDFTQPPEVIERLIRGMNSQPGAYTMFRGAPLKLWGSEILDGVCAESPGTVISADGGGIAVSAGGRAILLTMLQAPGKKAMTAADFIRGNRISVGEIMS
ncbi:MAG: methionyl-tRNA formyltransferase [Clostridiales Family XIII bacterium]|jgi:methionyl-tRNA formyltransferase|nr:methionyl-tRNA formyltransferase [Clostridiales Family XIII bacterium]